MSAAVLLPLLVSCNISEEASSHVYENFDVSAYAGVEFPEEAFTFGELLPPYIHFDPQTKANILYTGAQKTVLTVFEKIDIYESVYANYPYLSLRAGESVVITEPYDEHGWSEVFSPDGAPLGFARYPRTSCVNPEVRLYARVPYESGITRDSDGNEVTAYSHLTDVSEHLNVLYSGSVPFEDTDLTGYDVCVEMKLSTADTSAEKPFYRRNLCLLQYDTLMNFKKAVQILKNDGYTPVIYDAYRPTSVHRAWHLADSSIPDPDEGMGGIHDRGCAIDLSLLDSDGKLLVMPTALYAFDSDRSASEQAKLNAGYLKSVMESCGFVGDDTKWWHFESAEPEKYLPTDHAVDSIALVPCRQSTEGRLQ